MAWFPASHHRWAVGIANTSGCCCSSGFPQQSLAIEAGTARSSLLREDSLRMRWSIDRGAALSAPWGPGRQQLSLITWCGLGITWPLHRNYLSNSPGISLHSFCQYFDGCPDHLLRGGCPMLCWRSRVCPRRQPRDWRWVAMAGAGGGAWLSPPSQRTRAAEIAVGTHAPSHTHVARCSVLIDQCHTPGRCHAYSSDIGEWHTSVWSG